jgi:uncharacterized repeat protein (TIGR01451 family)
VHTKSYARLFLLAALLLLALPALGLAQADEAPSPSAPLDPALLDALAEPGATADFFVFMAAQADLSPAQRIADWGVRGRYVYDALRQMAESSQAPVLAYARDHGLTYRSFLTNNAVYIEGGDRTAAEALAQLPGVARIRLPEVATILPDLQPAPASSDEVGWNLDTLDPANSLYGMQAAQVWDQYGITGEGIVVANIDTGVYYQHISLDRQYRGNTTGEIGGPYEHDHNWYQPNFQPCGNGTYPCDAENHGTSTMGIMVAETPDQVHQPGVAPSARWIACQGCDDPPYCTEAALTGCADWMLAPCAIGDDPGDPSCDPELRPHIINNSWGGGGCSTWYQPYVQAWVAAGMFPAFAAGNAGGCGTVASPGDLPESFGTAAHFTDGQNAYAGGPSCFYPTPTCDPAAHDIDPHVNAPTGGNAPINQQGEYFPLGGTSGASPHTAGTVALLWAGNPGLIGQIDATFTILEQSANRDLPTPNCGKPACAGANGYPNYDFGWGYLDALAAVELAGAGSMGTLAGTVTEAAPIDAPGDPLPDVTITAQRLNTIYPLHGETGPTGVYSLTLPSGTYTVTADGPQHGPATVTGVDIVTDTLITVDFQLLPKGLLYGYVTDVETGAPLAATVTSPGAGSADTDPATGYYTLYLGQGTHDIVVQASNYASQTASVDIISGEELPRDFQLIAALALAPRPLDATVELFGNLDLTTVITNRTAAAYDYQLVHEAARAGDEGPILLVHDEVLDENPDAFAIAFDNLGYDFVLVDAADFYSTSIPDLLDYAAVVYTGSPSAGAEQDHVIAYLEAGGRFLLSDFVFTPNYGDSRLHQVFLQALDDGLEEWAGVQNGLDIMAGLYPDISSQVIVYDSYAGPEGVGIFQSPGSHFTGIRTERAGYRAIFLSFDLNRIGARDPGDAGETDVVYRAMLWLLGYPVEALWYSTDVASGTIPANGSGTFTSQFAAMPAVGIDQPGEFYAELHVEPAAMGEIYPRLDVPVHLTVVPPPTMGKVAGVVTSDRPGGPMATDVQIEGAGGGSWTTRSDWWTGGYGYWLEAGDYTLTVAAEGYYTETVQVTVVAGLTTTQDFPMVLAAPEISLAPLALDETVPFGTAITRSLRVDNSGPEPLDFEVQERDRGLTPLAASLLEATPEGVDGAQILFDEYHGGNPTYYSELFADLQSLGATVDVWSAGPITTTVLAGYDILFVGDFLDVEYGFAELDAIDAFVRQGGGLFVTYECCDDTTAPVLTKMYGIVYIGAGGVGGVTYDIYPHPTTRDVGAVYIPSPQYVMTATVTGTAEIILYDTGGWPAAAVNEVDNGKVFVMPDQEFWDGVYAEADNTQFGRNVFGWLYGDVDWLDTDVTSATVPPGEALTLTVTLDGAAVEEPAIYYGDLVLPNNDPLAPSLGVPITLTVEPTPDLGKLHGTVTSDRPGDPLPAALRIEDSAGVTLTVYSLPSTGVYQRWLPSGVYTVTASSAGYISQTAPVQVPPAGDAQLDFELLLDAPGVATLPPAVEETLIWGLTTTQRLTVANVGLRDLDFTLQEEDLGGQPLVQGTQAYAFDFENDDFVTFYLDGPGEWIIIKHWDYQHFEAGDFRLNDFSQLYVIHGAYLYTLDTATGDDTYVAYIDIPYPHQVMGMTIAADGTLYAVTDYWWGTGDHESYLWTIDPVYGTPTQIGQITNAELIAGIAIDLAGQMYGVDAEQDLLIQIDPATAAGTVVGSLGFDLWYGTLEYDDDTSILYMATWDYLSGQSYLWMIDTDTGTPIQLGNFPPGVGLAFVAIVADGLLDIPWLDETPTAGTVPPGGGLGIDLAFDASVVEGPGTYWGHLHVQSNDPLLPDLPVPITMTVLASGDLGEVAGTVAGLGHCDADSYPLEAQIVLEAGDGMTWTVTSDPADGSYSRWVPAGTYTATASALSHVDATAIVQVEAAQTILQDFDLRLFEPCLMPTPATFSLTLSMGTLWTETLTIANGGARDLAWTLRETTDTLALPSGGVGALPAFPPIPPFEGEWPPESAPGDQPPTSIEPAPWSVGAPPGSTGGVPQGDEAPASLPELLGEPAYALDTSTFDLVHIPHLTDPGTWDVVANLGVFYSGGDFWHGDFSKMYALDFWTNDFVTIDTSTGERTVIGTANTLPGHHWTGLTAATDGTLYGVSSECNVSSALYTIDHLTGEATLVGTTIAAPCLIDVAANAQGELYAVDISSDALFQLNPASGAATLIGLLGYDANHAQAIDFEEETDVLYWAAVNEYSGSLRRIDTDTGNSLHVGYWPNYTGVDCLALATGGGDPFWGDVPWVREVPTTGLTLAGDAMEVDVVFDTTVLTTGQCYEAGLGMIHDDPYHQEPAMMPLTLCVEAPWPVFYLEKSVAPGQPLPGETTTYTLVFGNDGSLETGIVISDVLPYGVEYGWSEPAGTYDPAAHELTWSGLVLDAGSRMTATVVGNIGVDMEPGIWMTNTVYLLWRDQVLSDWASLQVGGEARQYIYLPVVVKHHAGE